MKLTAFAAALVLAAAGCANDPVNVVKNQPPVANAGADQSARKGAVVAFDGSASKDPDGSIAAFAWDFGDGTTGTNVQASHIYNAGGAFTVTLTVTDDAGAQDADSAVVTVDANQAPIAVIDAPSTGSAAASIHFDGSGSSDPDGTIASWSWDFGDGSNATGPQVDHAFSAAGGFDVVLTVTDDRGAQGSATATVTVDAVTSFDGQWSWTLVDPSQRDLGFVCGTFEDSMLTVLTNAPSMTITESAGSASVAYTGSLTGSTFDCTNNELGIIQEITGSFDSPTSFTGFYKINPGFTSCADRAVIGTKVGN